MRNFVILLFTVVMFLSITGCENPVKETNTTEIYYGNTSLNPGTKVISSWTDESGNIKINGKSIPKTSEVIIIPTNKIIKIDISDNSSWDSYFNGTLDPNKYYSFEADDVKGVFIKDRNIILDPYVMSQYEITQKLYKEIMNLTDTQNPSVFKDSPAENEIQDNRPIENITWLQACAFCNEFTIKTMNTNDCIYYSDSLLKTRYTKDDSENFKRVYIAYDKTTHKWLKKGYRLPTEAEWEFAARGGNPKAPEWKFAYAGLQTSYDKSEFMLAKDNVSEYSWYDVYTGITHEVGKKRPNSLNLYDMSGNVWEYCFDYYDSMGKTQFFEHDNYFIDNINNYITNPLGLSDEETGFWSYYNQPYDYHIHRGGDFSNKTYLLTVSFRNYAHIKNQYSSLGFRVCRSCN